MVVKRTPVTSKTVKSANNNEELDFIKQLAEDVNGKLKSDMFMVGDSGGDEGVPYWVLTGIPQLDFAVGGINHPGFPGARFIEVFGGEGAGKSTLAVWLTKQAIEQVGAIACYQDAERVLTPEIIKGTGIDMGKVIRAQPDTLEEVFDAQEAILESLSKSAPDKPVVITLDSIAACSTKSEIDGDMEDVQMAPHARLMSKGLRKIKSPITDSSVLSVWVNQTREKMNVSWGDNTSTFGGKAMAYYASVRIQLAKVKTLKKDKGDPYGCTIEATIKKNKVAPPMKKVQYDILFVEDESGSYPKIDIAGAILDWCKEKSLIGGGQGRYEIEGKSMFKEQAREMLENDEDLFNKYKELAYSVARPIEEE